MKYVEITIKNECPAGTSFKNIAEEYESRCLDIFNNNHDDAFLIACYSIFSQYMINAWEIEESKSFRNSCRILGIDTWDPARRDAALVLVRKNMENFVLPLDILQEVIQKFPQDYRCCGEEGCVVITLKNT